MHYTYLGCRKGFGCIWVLLYILKMDYYCSESTTEMTTFLLLGLNAFQPHIWTLNNIKYRSLPNFQAIEQ